VKKQTPWLALLCVLSLAQGGLLWAVDETIVSGREDRWEDFRLDHLSKRTGRWGTPDLVLSDDRYEPEPGPEGTDLLLHFDAPAALAEGTLDETGGYRITAARVLVSDRLSAIGTGAAAFTGPDSVLRLRGRSGTLLAPGASWGDFSIELWLYGALLADGEQVLSWTGERWRGGEGVPQAIGCEVEGRRLTWSFENLFGDEAGGGRTLVLQGLTPLLPRTWHHHLVRYDGTTGMLEYLVDGIPEAVLYATSTGRERGDLLIAVTGDARSGDLEIGRGFVGFLDELRISRRFVQQPVLSRFSGRTGVATSGPLDLGYTGTRLRRIEAVYDSPSDSAVYFFYRLSDRWDLGEHGEPWRPFTPGQLFDEARGRYLQVMVELFPDGRRSVTPRVSELRVVYQQDLPPPPPSGVYSVAQDGAIELHWNRVNEEDVRGYLVYYGEAPGNYHGTDSALGPSPLDVGDVSQIRLTGLQNRKLYYFAVVAYDAADPPHRSLFSRETSSRPAELFAAKAAAPKAAAPKPAAEKPAGDPAAP
jgi:hypothetical protein